MRTILLFALAGICLAGTRPRTSAFDYRLQASQPGVTVAAEMLPPEQVKNTFSTSLTEDYLVVEVALFPDASGGVEVRRDDFALRVGGETIRPADPAALARTLQRKNGGAQRRRGDIDVYPTVGVGYENGDPYGRDPYGRDRRGGHVYTTAGVGVATGGAGSQRPASTDRDRDTMQMELRDKGLTEGSAAKPVSGYLYFPYPAKKQKKAALDLEHFSRAGTARLTLK
jgi:hypothetical protein